MEMGHPQTNVNLTYITQTGSTGDMHVELDRFGRVVSNGQFLFSWPTIPRSAGFGFFVPESSLYPLTAPPVALQLRRSSVNWRVSSDPASVL
ncbi:hypothetical protein BH10PLA2_BH10PLA2_24410 [soil metagenome]